MTTKTYSSKSNALRAAKTAGLDPATITFVQQGDGWTWTALAVEPVAEPAAPEFEAPVEEIAAQVTRPSVLEMATAIEAPDTPEGQTIAAQIKNWRETGKSQDFRHERKTPAKKPKAEGTTTLRPDGLREGSAMAKLVDAVLEDGGKTNAELCALVGWAQCLPMLRKACAKAGVELDTVKDKGQPTRYFAVRPKPAKAAKAA